MEKEFWEKKGKDILQLVHNYTKQSLNSNNKVFSNTNRANIKSKYTNNNFTKKVQTNKTTNLRDEIRAYRDKIKNKQKDITDLSNDNNDTSNNDEDVQEVVSNNHLYVSDDENCNEIYSDAFSEHLLNSDIYINNISDNIIQTNYNNELAIIESLASKEKHYAHPLLVQVELNDIIQNVLLDHGATRNLVRKSTLDKYYKNIYNEYLSNKCALISSSGTSMPILSRIKLTVRIGENEYQDALFYVVSDTPIKRYNN